MLMPLRNTGAELLPGRHDTAVAWPLVEACVHATAPARTSSASSRLRTYSSRFMRSSPPSAEPPRESLVGDPADRQLNSKPRSAREPAKNHVNQPVRRWPGMNGCSDPGWAARHRDNPTA